PLYLGTDRLLDLFDDLRLKSLAVYAAQAASIVQHVMLVESLERDNKSLKAEVKASRFGSLIGACAGMQDVFARVTRVAPTDVPVLVLGETGTGKELVAREVHARGPRSVGPFVAINCGAIPEALLESELFGHVRGAFTGAVASTIGKFHAASGGTLFLDEIGELPLNVQVKLLRVLQDSMVMRVGGSRPERVNVRVVCATNKDLAAEVKAGRFREDLYYRVCVVSVTLPPLRERGDDVEVLAQYFLNRFAAEFSSPVRAFTPEALKAMRKYRWPGNIRELENRVRKAVLFSDGGTVKLSSLELPEKEEPEETVPLAIARERFERDYVMAALARNHGNRTQTARDLGVEPRTIFRYLEKERDSGRDV
ncbi:MAG: sigma-54-dependent Fis family transcriptional regulator, partial [Deltaproteobacteria bacterium]|nr:sigma-54-dependent Fis family transcriptional regulator [Deltaproteobacteria bacterium]